ncbi:MAG: transglycosylase domain-containing protein [Deltaproteobacteria bacterium]|nr:transglycosylase domain-containing protein [Deltaproteobacteria bacterium]
MKKKKIKKPNTPARSNRLRIALFCFLGPLLALALYLSFLYYQVSQDAAIRIDRGAIENIIFSESPVYYDDGKSILGVFFEKTHRKYIQFKDIPPSFIKALIAAEDRNYYQHPGFDIKAVIRAFIANIKARRVIQGGSTLTQQTAKNIFKRERRSYQAKLKELMQSLLLERRYSKQEILEMYVNQFFVTGFGRGLEIAAQYFFDKGAEDLDLVESAFIAGSVKGPYLYNPFTKKSNAERIRALQLAKERKDYVLGNMVKLQFITKAQYLEGKAREVPFKEGRVTYRLNVIMNYIREQLESPYFRKILEDQGVDNVATSGIKIYTSINQDIQEGALRSIRRHLPVMDVKLSGYDRARLQLRYQRMAGNILKKAKNELPFLSRITYIHRDPPNPHIMVAWGTGGGIINFDGFKTMGEAWLKGEMGNWAVFDSRHILSFLKNFQVGDLVPVQMIEEEDIEGKKKLMLSRLPELEGAIIVLKEGMVRAMVGGFFNRFFNRAVDAKRQLGSIFKTIVYTAALQLKWNNLDELVNKRDLYQFENTTYLPRPDHLPQSEMVSMAWAGVKSENLATVWLLYHLMDRLNMGEFRKVVELLELHRGEEESYQDYVTRIRDQYGVLVNRDALMEAAFEESKGESEADLIFSGYEEALGYLRRLHFSIDPSRLNEESQDERKLYQLSFQRLQFLNFEMKKTLQQVRERIAANEPLFDVDLSRFHRSSGEDGKAKIIYADPEYLSKIFPSLPLTPEWFEENHLTLEAEEIWIDGLLPARVIDTIQMHMKKTYERLVRLKKYDPEVLFRIRDFRTLVSLHYVTRLAKILGVATKLDPVLSFPLGANAVSIMEASQAYQTMMTGNLSPRINGKGAGTVPIITKIVDREGLDIWEYRPQGERVLTTGLSGQISEILRMVMTEGTGRRARGAVRLSLDVEEEKVIIPIPSFGKTGTSNRFTNSSFVGLIPGEVKGKGLEVRKGYVIGAYVGYDNNRPMKGKQVVIYGSSGALLLWIDTANAIVNSTPYKGNLDIANLAFDTDWIGLSEKEGFQQVLVSSTTGLPVGSPETGAGGEGLEFYSFANWERNQLQLKRLFEPILGVKHGESFSN